MIVATRGLIIFLLLILVFQSATSQSDIWQEVNSGLDGGQINSIIHNRRGELIAGGTGGLFKSADSGGSWSRIKNGLPSTGISAFLIDSSGRYWAGCSNSNGTKVSLYSSVDDGTSWQQAAFPALHPIYALATNQLNHAFVAGYGIQRSKDGGNSWEDIGPPVFFYGIVCPSDSEIIAVSPGDGAFRSTDAGQSWTAINNGISSLVLLAVSMDPFGRLFAGDQGGAIYRSLDSGSNWQWIASGGGSITCFNAATTGQLYAGSTTGLERSTDGGSTWGFSYIGGGSGAECIDVGSDGGVFVGTNGLGLLWTSDHGSSWSARNSGLHCISATCIVTLPSGAVIAGTNGWGFVRSTDHGDSWERTNQGVDDLFIVGLSVCPNGVIFAAPSHTGLFRSTDSGDVWTRTENGIPPGITYVSAICASKSNVLIGTDNVTHHLYRSSNYGEIWEPSDTGLPSFASAFGVATSGALFATAYYDGTFRSLDNGISWSSVNLPSRFASSYGFGTDGVFFAGIYGDQGVLRSLDGGLSWSPASSGLTNWLVHCLLLPTGSREVFVGTEDGVFRTTDNGNSWNDYSSGLSNFAINALTKDSSGFIYAATSGGGICRSVDVVSSASSQALHEPKQYSLEQNYPNPFNQSTIIRYDLPEMSAVKLRIYNLLGQLVAILREGIEGTGLRQVNWSGENVSTGIYFCQFEATAVAHPNRSFAQVRKLVMVK